MNQIRLFITALLLVIISSNVSAITDTTTITGYLPGGGNHEVRLLTITDRISFNEEILDRTMIDSTGKFSFSLMPKETMVAFLDMDYYTISIYLEPGTNYEIVSDSVPFDNLYRPYTKKERLPCTITSDRKPDLNTLLSEFNSLYNLFIENNFKQIYAQRKRYLIYNFADSMKVKYDTVNNEFFQNYITYKVAEIELAGAPTARNELFAKYLKDKPVLYNHPEYMFFFNQFFNQYITSVSKTATVSDLKYTVNYLASYPALLDSLGKDTILRNEVIRELVMLKELKDIYYSGNYYQQNIIKMLKEVSENDVFPEHRMIANNIIKVLTKLNTGTKAPDFTIPDINGDTVSLSSFFGKPVYLGFLTTWSYACLGEMKILKDVYEKYGKRINFVMVSLDEGPDIVRKLVKEKGYNWTFLYNGDGYDVLRDYGVETFPLFVLINKNGEIMQYPAPKPSENIESVFEKLTLPSIKK
jgi:peroxiredoxin